MALSKFMQEIAQKIQRTSGAEINFSQSTSRPTQSWVAKREICEKKEIQLRSAEETKSESEVKLRQFNPSVLLNDESEIYCRAPDCSTTIPRQKAPGKVKQDLFLCNKHRAKLTREIGRRCAEENVYANVENFKPDDFKGYTSLIGQLEKAFLYLKKKSSSYFWRPSKCDSLLGEVFLNTRNFLIITNALLNPSVHNMVIALCQFFKLFANFLNAVYNDNSKLGEEIREALKEVRQTILYFFGIACEWIVVDFFNPGGRIGAGVGLVLGFAGGVVFPATGSLATCAVGFVGGGLIGSGAFSLYERRRYYRMQEQVAQEYLKLMSNVLGRPVESANNLIFVFCNQFGDLAITRFAQNY